MSVDRTTNNLSRFQFSCPAWWAGFTRGRKFGRELAIYESADWRPADFNRGKIEEGVAT